jgi:hypothetical protein
MIFAANPAEYLPNIKFFQLMKNADKFVIADDIQYVKHSLINRTKIKTAHGALLFLTVPVSAKNRKIKDVQIVNEINWQNKHWKTILHKYRLAPYFEYYAEHIQPIFNKKWIYLIDLNIALIEIFKELLKINTLLSLSSALNLSCRGDEKLIHMAKILYCDTYLVDIRYKPYLNQNVFDQEDIELLYSNYSQPVYNQQMNSEFLADLSIIDLLMNKGPDTLFII